jgi:hypothetical protein
MFSRGEKMKHLSIIFIAVFIVAGAFAASGPQIISSGVDPVTVQPGERFTLYAEVMDAEGFSDILAVALFFDDTYLLTLPESDIPGRYQTSFVMPENVDAGLFTMNVLVADKDLNISDPYHFSFAIAGDDTENSVTLIDPEDGAQFDCGTDITFSWEPYSDDFAAYAFAFYLPNGAEIIVPLSDTITEVTVPGEAWRALRPGDYFWKVGVFPERGEAPEAWSELRMFTVNCDKPSRIFGMIIEIDPETQSFVLQGKWRDQQNQTVVLVTDDTVIQTPDGEFLSFDDLQLQDFALCLGHFSDDIFTASKIMIKAPPNPGIAFNGVVNDIDHDEYVLIVETRRPGFDDIVVQVTEDTVIKGRYGAMSFEDIEIGNRILVKGEWNDDLFYADKIFVRPDAPPPPPPPPIVAGMIHEIDSENLVLYIGRPNHGETTAVQITDDTELLGREGPITFDEISIGMMAKAWGDWNGEIFVADKVFVGPHVPPPPPMK